MTFPRASPYRGWRGLRVVLLFWRSGVRVEDEEEGRAGKRSREGGGWRGEEGLNFCFCGWSGTLVVLLLLWRGVCQCARFGRRSWVRSHAFRSCRSSHDGRAGSLPGPGQDFLWTRLQQTDDPPLAISTQTALTTSIPNLTSSWRPLSQQHTTMDLTTDQEATISALRLSASNDSIGNAYRISRAIGISLEDACNLIAAKANPFLYKIPVEIRLLVYTKVSAIRCCRHQAAGEEAAGEGAEMVVGSIAARGGQVCPLVCQQADHGRGTADPLRREHWCLNKRWK